MARENGEHIIEALTADLDNYHTALRQLKAIHERAPLAHEKDGLMDMIAGLAGMIARCEMKIVQTKALESWSISMSFPPKPTPSANPPSHGGQ